VAQPPELGLMPNRPPSTGGPLAPLVVSANCAHLLVWHCAGEMFLCIVAVIWCGSLELLGWPWLAGVHPLHCPADPLMDPL
jgi:hypothetical protein